MKALIILFILTTSVSADTNCVNQANTQQSDELIADIERVLTHESPTLEELNSDQEQGHVVQMQIATQDSDVNCFETSTNQRESGGCLYHIRVYADMNALLAEHGSLLGEERVAELEAVEDFGQVTLVLALINDSGLYGLIREIFNTHRTDDDGYTHGAYISLSDTFPRFHNLTIGASYRTDLYTYRLNGEEETNHCRNIGEDNQECRDRRHQYFTNDTAITLSIGQTPREGFRWRVGLGVHILDSETTGGNFLLANQQQIDLHRATNISVPTNIPNGRGTQVGPALELEASYYSPTIRFLENNILIQGNVGGSIFASTVEGAQSVSLLGGAEIVFQDSSGTIGAGINTDMQFRMHQTGMEPLLSVGLGLYVGPVSLHYSNHTYLGGELQNYQGYNLPSRYTDVYGYEDLGTIQLVLDFAHWAWRRN